MRQEYTEKLMIAGENRKRLTKGLIQLSGSIADKIASILEPGSNVIIGPEGDVPICQYQVCTFSTHLGDTQLLAVLDDIGKPFVITTGHEPGSKFYLHGDLEQQIVTASREQFLAFCNDLPEIVLEFTLEQKAIASLIKQGFEKLRQYSESVE